MDGMHPIKEIRLETENSAKGPPPWASAMQAEAPGETMAPQTNESRVSNKTIFKHTELGGDKAAVLSRSP